MARALTQGRRVRRALNTLPLSEADTTVLGRHDDVIQAMLRYPGDSPYWTDVDHTARVADTSVPVSSIGGWFDAFTPGQLRDFRILQDAGKPARLTVGPWPHASVEVLGTLMRDLLEFGAACARGETPPERAPVRLFVMGHNEGWSDFASWPPPDSAPQPLYLQTDAKLRSAVPVRAGTDSYRYDPADPTPAVGGIQMQSTGKSRVDNRIAEARPDVLTYSTDPLEEAAEVIGEVAAEIWFQSSRPSADVFVRLCDVDPSGRSLDICDGLTTVTDAQNLTCVRIRLWPTAYRFAPGHRIRVQVSSGAFPRYNRNLGTGEPRATAATLHVADQTVYHDLNHPSAIILPVRRAP
ncbi:CocE/NonD family hydrolase [Nocardia sp. CA2R105]|nr:CocE/NonD family hydrolase [Nocardia coffeae]